MHISKIRIENFKCFKGPFILLLNDGLNILVGDNEAGKSTIIEAIHLVLTGILNGKHLKYELNEYIFNNEAVSEYLNSLKTTSALPPPKISIELYFEGGDYPFFEGDANSDKKKNCCVTFTIELDESLKDEYNLFISSEDVTNIPIDYYAVYWTTCARESITPRSIAIKSALIDSSSNRYKNGSDVYISHIIQNHLTSSQKIDISQAYRKMQDLFLTNDSVQKINDEIKKISKKTEQDKVVNISADLTSKNAWENSLLTYVENVPFHFIGKGEQSIIKTKLALEHNKAKEANVILIEEPENHLSHTKLNQLIYEIKNRCDNKQIIISTHSSFVANKLGLKSLILLNNRKTMRLIDLTPETVAFFEKISGYDTLRFILSKSVILCEGDSDELIIQKAYMNETSGKLPIEDSIEVMSVGLSFARYAEIAKILDKRTAIVTDNDGKTSTLDTKYKEYKIDKSKIKAFYDDDDTHPTLEPQLLKYNNITTVNKILDQKYIKAVKEHKVGDYKFNTKQELLDFMTNNKTDCALKFFDTVDRFIVPPYILNAINHAKE